MIGYGILGLARPTKKLAFIVFGPSNSGKSLLFSLIHEIMKFYITPMDKSVFIKPKHEAAPGSHTTQLIQLLGKRMTFLADALKKGDLINEEMLKPLLGLDPRSARDLYESARDIELSAVPYIHANFLPRCDYEESILEKIRVMEFFRQFKLNPSSDPNDKEFPLNENLYNELIAEKEGILKLLVDWAYDFNQDSTEPDCPVVKEATKRWQLMQSDLNGFIKHLKECNLIHDGVSTKRKEIYYNFYLDDYCQKYKINLNNKFVCGENNV